MRMSACRLVTVRLAGTPKAMTCEGSQLLADLMELQELRVQGWLPKSLKLPPGSCVKLMFIVRTLLETWCACV